jgi:hypothetical protein
MVERERHSAVWAAREEGGVSFWCAPIFIFYRKIEEIDYED